MASFGAADKFVKIHDIASGKLVVIQSHQPRAGVTWHDGRSPPTGTDNAIKVWNVETANSADDRRLRQTGESIYMGRGPGFVSCGGDKTVRFHQETTQQHPQSRAPISCLRRPLAG
jgi:hypothetical protein